ncbi:uncharacterized protein LOC106086633 isoform X2 [Stomoxys calcitrans]|nr:uncharacterized protein LOC106086633 isoform X2 [Stomoxys calcitrans]
MVDNPIFAMGMPVYGACKSSVEEQWKALTKKLNFLGPPTRTTTEWKKTWADLKSRTKKKLIENNKCLEENEGGIYRYNPLTEFEQAIERTVFRNRLDAPSDITHGSSPDRSEESSEEVIECTKAEIKPSENKVEALISPTRSQEELSSSCQQLQNNTYIPINKPATKKQIEKETSRQQKHSTKSSKKIRLLKHELPGCSPANKKSKPVEQIMLIKHQLRISEEMTSTVKTVAGAASRMALAVERSAAAIEAQNNILQEILKEFKEHN